MSDLVTGEAVVLDLRLARLASRGLAMAIDVAVQFAALALVLLLYFSALPRLDGALAAALGIAVAVTVLVGYPVVLETLSRGRTLGKLALGLRVVCEDGGPIRFRQALIRGLAGFFVDFWVLGLGGAVAIFVSLASVKGKRVGDFLAGTVVLRERLPVRDAEPAPMPPGLAGWAAGLDVHAVPDGLALAIRQYLNRYPTLEPTARDALGAGLTAEVSAHLGVPLPTNPAYLAAVLAERRSREQAKLWQDVRSQRTTGGGPDDGRT